MLHTITPITAEPQRQTPTTLRPAAPGWTVRAHGASHKGFVRTNNEDHFLIANVTTAIQIVQANLCSDDIQYGPSPSGLYIVADGMGGHADGERASALAITSLERFLLTTLSRSGGGAPLTTAALLRAGFLAADDALINESEGRPALDGMGTTMTAALISGSEVHICHAGDSRAYLLRCGDFAQLTKDHNVAAELLSAGLIRENEGVYRALKHIITNVIGGGSRGVTPEVMTRDASPGDRLLLCSDGLTDMVSDDKMREILISAASPDVASYRLIEAALAGGGFDNVTAVVIDIDASN